jgi:hypothetical protein
VITTTSFLTCVMRMISSGGPHHLTGLSPPHLATHYLRWIIYCCHTICIRNFHVRCFFAPRIIIGSVRDAYAPYIYILFLPAPPPPFLHAYVFAVCSLFFVSLHHICSLPWRVFVFLRERTGSFLSSFSLSCS